MPCFLVVTGEIIKWTRPILRHNGPIQDYFGYLSVADVVKGLIKVYTVCYFTCTVLKLILGYAVHCSLRKVLRFCTNQVLNRYKKKVNAKDCGVGEDRIQW